MVEKYIDSCRTLEILKQDSGLLPKPTETWNTFEPKVGDLAYVDENRSEYEFDGTDWIKKEVPSWKEEAQSNLSLRKNKQKVKE